MQQMASTSIRTSEHPCSRVSIQSGRPNTTRIRSRRVCRPCAYSLLKWDRGMA